MKDIVDLTEYLVVFLDVLGQREKLRSLKKLPVTPSDDEQILNTLKKTAGFIIELRKGFGNIFNEFNDKAIDEFLSQHQLSEEEISQFKSMSRIGAKYQGFSDSVIISIALSETEDTSVCVNVNGIFASFVAACGMFIFSLAARHALRGGLDVGLAVELDRGEVYGAALERAYYLESKIAEYPRLIVGEELVKRLKDLEKPNSKKLSYAEKCARIVARKCNEFLMRDSDGNIILDCLGKAFYENGGKEMGQSTINKAYDFVKEQYSYWNDIKDEKLIRRYQKLLDYFEKRAHLWGVPLS